MKPIAEMTNNEFMAYMLQDMLQGWVPLNTYLKLLPSETKTAVIARVNRGHWQRGVHYNVPAGGTTWVCLTAIREWATSTGREKESDGIIHESLPLDKE